MKSWARQLAAQRNVKDNFVSNLPDKIELRQRLLDAIPDARVLDAFAGSGEMYRRVWHRAAGYVGCDVKWFADDPRPSYVCDNLRLLRCLDLSEFNIFDLDAYGSPWQQATIIAARRVLRPGEIVGFAFTDGAMMSARLGRVEGNLAEMAGVDPKFRGANRIWEDVNTKAMIGLAHRLGGEVSGAWSVDNLRRPVVYTSCLIKSRVAEAATAA